MRLEKFFGKTPLKDQQSKFTESRERFAKKIGGLEFAHYNAIFEKHLREELKTRNISMDDADISKIIGIPHGVGGPTRSLETIDNTVYFNMDNESDGIGVPGLRMPDNHLRLLKGALGQEFFRRYPLDVLVPAVDAAKKSAEAEVELYKSTQQESKEREDAKKTIEEL